jgi:hypothetical protein
MRRTTYKDMLKTTATVTIADTTAMKIIGARKDKRDNNNTNNNIETTERKLNQ